MGDDSLNKILQKASDINDKDEFKSTLIELCEAHACHVRVSEALGDKNGRKAIFEISSRVDGGEVKEYFQALVKRLKAKSEEDEDETIYTPSNFWKEVHTDEDYNNINEGGHPSKKLHGAIVGYTGELENQTEFFVFVEWEKTEQSENHEEYDNSEMNGNVETVEFKKDDLNQGKENYDGEVNLEKVYHPEDIPEKWIRWIASTAEYHLCGDKPVSFITIPVALKPTPYNEPRQYLSVEIIWFGKPVPNYAIENLYEVSILAKYVGARLLLGSKEETLFKRTLRLAKKVNDECHTLERWRSNFKSFLLNHTQISNEIVDNLSSVLKSEAFHKGLKRLHSRSPDAPGGYFSLESLFTVVVVYSLTCSQKIEISIDILDCYNVLDKLKSLIFNYKRWAEFIEYFHEEESEHGGYVKTVELETGVLSLKIASADDSEIEESIEELGKSMVNVWLNRVDRGSIVSRALLDAFLCSGDQERDPHFPFSFISRRYKIDKTSRDEKDVILNIDGEDKMINIKVHMDDE